MHINRCSPIIKDNLNKYIYYGAVCRLKRPAADVSQKKLQEYPPARVSLNKSETREGAYNSAHRNFICLLR